MKNKQTAVEWLVSIISSKIDSEYWSNQQDITEYVLQAKTMEKEQIKDAYMVCDDSGTLEESEIYAEIYYNRNYNINK